MRVDQATLAVITDSRGEDTLEAHLVIDGTGVSASVPSGKSKGLKEAYVADPARAVADFAQLESKLKAADFDSLEEFENFLIGLDGTPNKSRLGGNVILALGIAFAKAWAKLQSVEPYELIAKLTGQKTTTSPWCFFNLLEGGVHAKKGLPFQEYLLIPQVRPVKAALEVARQVLKTLQENLLQKYGSLQFGDEGGYTFYDADPASGLNLLQDSVRAAGSRNVFFGLDAAASTFYLDGYYQVGGRSYSGAQLLNLYQKIVTDFPLISIEDPYSELDWQGFVEVKKALGKKVWIVGDDITVTNPDYIRLAHKEDSINGVIIKPNQIGSVTETIKAALTAKSLGLKIIVSHRSGETMETFIADLAYGLGADGFKAGSPLQKERLVKYQRLVEIEEKLNL